MSTINNSHRLQVEAGLFTKIVENSRAVRQQCVDRFSSSQGLSSLPIIESIAPEIPRIVKELNDGTLDKTDKFPSLALNELSNINGRTLMEKSLDSLQALNEPFARTGRDEETLTAPMISLLLNELVIPELSGFTTMLDTIIRAEAPQNSRGLEKSRVLRESAVNLLADLRTFSGDLTTALIDHMTLDENGRNTTDLNSIMNSLAKTST